MNDPYIVASCGHSFDKKNIYDWVVSKKSCPVCKRHAELSDLIPNFALKSVIAKKKDELKKNSNHPGASPMHTSHYQESRQVPQVPNPRQTHQQQFHTNYPPSPQQSNHFGTSYPPLNGGNYLPQNQNANRR